MANFWQPPSEFIRAEIEWFYGADVDWVMWRVNKTELIGENSIICIQSHSSKETERLKGNITHTPCGPAEIGLSQPYRMSSNAIDSHYYLLKWLFPC